MVGHKPSEITRISMNDSIEIAALYRCDRCRVWWSSREIEFPNAQLLFQMADQHQDLFPWEDYQGWQPSGPEAVACPECGYKVAGPMFLLTQSGDLC